MVLGMVCPWGIRSLTTGMRHCMALDFSGYWSDLGRDLVLPILTFIGSSLFILQLSLLEVATRYSNIWIKLMIFCWNSYSSISKKDCEKHKRSGSGCSGNSEVRSPFEAKYVSPFDLERRSLPNRSTGAVSHSKKNVFQWKVPETFALVEIEAVSEFY